MHLSPTLSSYPHYFSPAPTIFPAKAPKVASEAESFCAPLSGFSLPYKQSTPASKATAPHQQKDYDSLKAQMVVSILINKVFLIKV